MKTEETQVDESHEVKTKDLDDVSGVPGSRPTNDTRTEVGDPMRHQFADSMLHRGRDHVTGNGPGPPFRQRRRTSTTSGRLYQNMARMRKSSVFDSKGVLKPMYPHTVDNVNLDMHQSLPYRAGAGVAKHTFNNPLTDLADTGPIGGGLGGAALGGVLGLGGSWLYNKLFAKKDKELDVKKWGLLSSLAGAGIGAYSGHMRSTSTPGGWKRQEQVNDGVQNFDKATPAVQEAATTQANKNLDRQFPKAGASYNAQATLMNEVSSAGLPFNLVRQLSNAIQGLSGPEARSVRAAAGGLSGFALGMYLSQRLGLGGAGSLGLSLASGALTSNLFGSVGNQRGQVTRDLYGNPW